MLENLYQSCEGNVVPPVVISGMKILDLKLSLQIFGLNMAEFKVKRLRSLAFVISGFF